MGCLLMFIGVFFPRIMLILGWLFGITSSGFEGWFFPLLGFIFMPCTTLAYACAQIYCNGIQGWGLLFLIIGIIFDLSSWKVSATSTTDGQPVS